MNVLEARGLASGYSHVPVLQDVDVVVGSGEIVGLLGANGAGKTTLLRTLAGVLRSAAGSIRVDGRDVSRLRPWDRVRIGLAHVQEGRHVFGAMTVDENLSVAALAAPHRRASIRSEVFELFPRLAERRSQLAGSMSGGEQQMLAIGRAMLCDPKVLLVDELSAGLAPVTATQLVDALVRIKERGVGILLVEQGPHLIADVVERVLLIEHGRIIAKGTFADLGGVAAIADRYLGVT